MSGDDPLAPQAPLLPIPNDRLFYWMRPSRSSRQEIVQKISEVFRRDSYSGATLVDLATAVGLGKASLYQKFPEGKSQMGAEVLTEVGRVFVDQVLSVLHQEGRPTARFAKMLAAITKFYQGGQLYCVIDTLSLGEGGRLYREALTRAIERWEEALNDLGREAGLSPAMATLWAEEVLVNIEGALVLARAKHDPRIFQRTLKRLAHSLDQ
jgi:TetR/AcrR family transcriptional repressor of lmrAB and yxaGH operons